MTVSLTSTLRLKILRLLLLHWSFSSSSKRFTVIVTSFILCKRISSCMTLSLDLSFVRKVSFERSFQSLKMQMLQIVLELRDHKRKELNLQRLLNLMKKRLYIVTEKKERQFSLIAAYHSVWCWHAVLSFHFNVSFSELNFEYHEFMCHDSSLVRLSLLVLSDLFSLHHLD